MRRFVLIAALFAVLAPGAAFAVRPDEMLKDPALEARARHLSEELRCMVCQNQSIDDSEAPLAHDLRVLVRQRLEAGDSDRQVLDYLVAHEMAHLREMNHSPRFWAVAHDLCGHVDSAEAWLKRNGTELHRFG